jgi:hypothetical protein
MDYNILTQQINLIFDREKIFLKTKGITWDINKNSDSIIYEHSDTLINLYTNLQDDELKEVFLDNLSDKFRDEKEEVSITQINRIDYKINSFSSSGALIFFTLLQLGFNDILKDIIISRTELCIRYSSTNVTLSYFLYDLLSTKKNYYDFELLTSLLYFSKKQINKYGTSYDKILSELQLNFANIGYEEIKKSISGVNIEINRDKEKLISIFSNNNFDEKYEHLLKEIDEYINTNSTIVTSGMISNMRSFMEDLVTDLARKIAANKNEQISENTDKGHMGNIRDYLKIKLELSDKDNQLINKYIDVLHSEGGHSFTSNVEYFRLAKNIGIEIGLFLLSKASKLDLLNKPRYNETYPANTKV